MLDEDDEEIQKRASADWGWTYVVVAGALSVVALVSGSYTAGGVLLFGAALSGLYVYRLKRR